MSRIIYAILCTLLCLTGCGRNEVLVSANQGGSLVIRNERIAIRDLVSRLHGAGVGTNSIVCIRSAIAGGEPKTDGMVFVGVPKDWTHAQIRKLMDELQRNGVGHWPDYFTGLATTGPSALESGPSYLYDANGGQAYGILLTHRQFPTNHWFSAAVVSLQPAGNIVIFIEPGSSSITELVCTSPYDVLTTGRYPVLGQTNLPTTINKRIAELRESICADRGVGPSNSE